MPPVLGVFFLFFMFIMYNEHVKYNTRSNMYFFHNPMKNSIPKNGGFFPRFGQKKASFYGDSEKGELKYELR